VSSISSVLITCSVLEHDAVKALTAWGRDQDPPVEFVQLDLDEAADAGVNATLRIDVFAAAQNGLDENALLALFRTFPWTWPGEALLVIYPEDGPPRTLRGDG
jgi:hypothetical protein